MNTHLRTQIFTFISGATLVAFFGGYFLGNKVDVLNFNSFDNVQASEQVDMEPFWKVWNLIEEKYVSASTTQAVSDEEKMYGALAGLVGSLGDPYSVFLEPKEKEQFDESISGVFQGVGMEVGLRDEILTVIAPLKNSPAQQAGVQSGDKIIAIDDKDAVGLTVEEAVALIRGEKGTQVRLKVIREGAEDSLEISITRDVIVVPTLETSTRRDVFIISLYNFGAGSTSEFRQALREFVLSKKNKLVLDLRNNPGGYLDAAVDISSWFLPAGKPVVIEDFGSNDDEKVFRSKGYNIFNENLKMVILIDQGSASASEIVAGALQEHGIATLMGQQSFGKGSVQELIPVTDTTAVKVTIARWLTPNGISISAGGLTPDMEVELDIEKYKVDETDTQLEAALEYLK